MNIRVTPGKARNAAFKWDPKGHNDGAYALTVSVTDKTGKLVSRFKREFQLAGGKQAAKLAEWEQCEKELKKLLSRYASAAIANKASAKLLSAKIALTKLALLLSELKSVIANNELEKATMVSLRIQAQSTLAENAVLEME